MTVREYPPHAMLTSEEAAPFIGVKPRTLREWRHRQRTGQPPYHKIGAAVRYRYGEIVKWLASNSVAND